MGKYFTVEVKPTLPASAQAANSSVFTNKDVLFDWTAFQLPKGAAKLTAITAVFRGTNGAVQVARDFDIVFAKSINGTAPVTLGTVNATVTAAPVVANHIIGFAHIDSIGDYGNSSWDYINAASTGSGAAASLIPEMVLQGEPESGDNVGYDTIYIGGIAAGAFDFGTTVLARGGEAAGVTVVETDKGSDNDPNADLIFAVGDVLHSATDDVLGTVSSIAAFGSSKQNITFAAVTPDVIGDNEEIFNINPIRIVLSFEK